MYKNKDLEIHDAKKLPKNDICILKNNKFLAK